MTDKKAILKRVVPIAVLEALTLDARQAVSQKVLVDGMVPVRFFPFRVGRETRVKIIDGRVERIERLQNDVTQPNNDLYLVDQGKILHISREHFQIEKDDDGFYLHDRGSATGTIVERFQIGGDSDEDTVPLKDGDTIVIGREDSPYIFKFIILKEDVVEEMAR